MPVQKGTTKARKPTALKLLHGSLNKSRENAAEPEPEVGPPAAPEYFTAAERAAWERFSAELLDLRVLTKVDWAALEALSCVYAKWQQAQQALRDQAKAGDDSLTYETVGEGGVTMQRVKPEMQILKELGQQLKDWLGRFGLTPADRGRVSGGKKNGSSARPEDEFR